MAKQISGIKGIQKARLQHYIEYAGLLIAMAIFRVIGLDRASSVGGWLGRAVGPKTKPHKTALTNLRISFPDWSEDKVQSTALDMWENFGRTSAEYAHLDKLLPYVTDSRVEVVGGEIIDEVMTSGKAVVYFSAHMANWELMSMCIRQRGYKLNGVYRSANNPLVNDWMIRQRARFQLNVQMPKGRKGARMLVDAMRSNEAISMLVDQKMNDGITVPFFGRPAKTAPAAAQFALKYDGIMVPVHIRRLSGARFRSEFHKPYEITPTENKQDDVAALTAQYTLFLEEQIRQAPGQWMWMHNRWVNSETGS